MKNIFPEKIRNIVQNKDFIENKVGKTKSKVYIFDNMVLKVQKKSNEVLNEINIMKRLENILPLPRVIQYEEQDDTSYTLMTKIKGSMISEHANTEQMIELLCDAFKMLWSIDINKYNIDDVSNIDRRLEAARYNIKNNLVDIHSVMPDTFGKDGFDSPEALLKWLETNIPEQDLVFTHGDFCFENILVIDNQISGFIDNGKAGVADRWQDLAICIRELDDIDTELSNKLLDKLGIKKDEFKLKYYMLLDELF